MSKLAKMIAVLLAVALVAVACKNQEGAEQGEEAAAEAAQEGATAEQADEESEEAEEDQEELAMVDVSEDGEEFDPPVQPEQIPDGAWYCDMGTVEYASMAEGDGSCPVCGMKLKQKPGGEATAEADEEGHEGHNH